MTLERRSNWLVLVAAVSGQVAYAVAAEKPGLIVLGLIAGSVSAFILGRVAVGEARPVSRLLLNTLILAAIANLVFQLIRPDRQPPITSLTDFLSFVMLVKMLDRQTARDEAQLLGLSLFVVIGALLTGQSLELGLALLVYTPVAILAAMSLQVTGGRERVRRRLRECGGDAPVTGADHAAGALTRWGGVCVAASLAAGLVGFLLTPRQLAQQLAGAVAPFNKSATTGFADSITLGNSGYINESNEPVMDVQVQSVEGTNPSTHPTLYLRGAVLNTYDHVTGRWSSGVEEPREGNRRGLGVEFDDSSRPWNDVIMATGELTVPGRPIRTGLRYDIVQRNTKSGRVPLFAPWRPVTVSTEPSLPMSYSATDEIVAVSGNGGRLAYRVTSSSEVRTTPDQRVAPPPPREFSPAVTRLAEQLMGDAGVDRRLLADSPAEVRRAAHAVVGHFKSFRYTLEMSVPDPGEDAIEMFLFRRKAGHCEYFASGMVALLQSMGVQSRIVTGYAAGEYNSVSGRYTVRRSDAHAWVEVLLVPGSGRWETFDPTPPGELPSARRQSGGVLGWIKQAWGAFEFSWLDNVVAYDKGLKLEIGRTGASSASAYQWHLRYVAATSWIKDRLPAGTVGRSAVIGVAVFAVIFLVLAVMRTGSGVLRRLARWIAGRFGRGASRGGSVLVVTEETRFYRRALDALEAAGLGKPAGSTPLRHAAAVSATRPVAGGAFADLACVYYEARFGGRSLSLRSAEIARRLSDLRSSLGDGVR